MSSALDLAGAKHTVTVDATETVFTCTDTVGGGELELQAGCTFQFDDIAGCGFLATSLPFTITATGTADAWVTIKSVESYPNHRWTLPPAATTFATTRVLWRDWTGTFSSAWIQNNPWTLTDQSIYATMTELQNLSGSTYGDSALLEMLAQATAEVNNRLSLTSISPAGADPFLRGIVLYKAYALVIARMVADGTRMGAINVDGHSTGEPLSLMKHLDEKADSMLAIYSQVNMPSSHKRIWAQKVNDHG